MDFQPRNEHVRDSAVYRFEHDIPVDLRLFLYLSRLAPHHRRVLRRG
jgi:hypothetical protein